MDLTFELPDFAAYWLLFMAAMMFSAVVYIMICLFMACHAEDKEIERIVNAIRGEGDGE